MGIFSSIQEKLFDKKNYTLDEMGINLALSKVQDPDLHKDIVTLGFVQNIKIKGNDVSLEVNLTTPACPVKEKLKAECEEALKSIPGIGKIQVTMTATTTRFANSASNAQTQAVPGLSKVRNIIAVASGKGGVGKSTTSVNLAYALASCGSKVGILDADIYGPSIPLMTKAVPVLSDNDKVEPLMADGIKVISIGFFNQGSKASILRGPMAAGVIKQFLTQVNWGELDYLIIDYPPGTGDIQLTISQTAPLTGAVVVTTPQEVALIDVRKAINMFETLKVPMLGIIETMSYFICDGCDKKHFIFREGGGEKVAREFGVALLGKIPMDANLVMASDQGQPKFDSYLDSAKNLAAQVSIRNAQDDGALKQFSIIWKND